MFCSMGAFLLSGGTKGLFARLPVYSVILVILVLMCIIYNAYLILNTFGSFLSQVKGTVYLIHE